jgi:hypothetical protein
LRWPDAVAGVSVYAGTAPQREKEHQLMSSESEQRGLGRQRRGDMEADTTQTYVRLAQQGDGLAGEEKGVDQKAREGNGLRKLWAAVWPFGRR